MKRKPLKTPGPLDEIPRLHRELDRLQKQRQSYGSNTNALFLDAQIAEIQKLLRDLTPPKKD